MILIIKIGDTMNNCDLAIHLGWHYDRGKYDLITTCQLCGGQCKVKYSLTATDVFNLQPGILENVTTNKTDESWEHIRVNCKKYKEAE